MVTMALFILYIYSLINLASVYWIKLLFPFSISESAPNGPQLGKNTGKPPLGQSEGRSSSSASPSRRRFPTKSISPQDSTPSTRPRQKVNLVGCGSFPDPQGPDVIIEEFLEEEQGVCVFVIFYFFID